MNFSKRKKFFRITLTYFNQPLFLPQAFSSIKVEEILDILNKMIDRLEKKPTVDIYHAATSHSWSGFESTLRKLRNWGFRLVMVLDNFERLVENSLIDIRFYNALRSAAGRLGLIFLTCSRKPLYELTYLDREDEILSSLFFNIFAQLHLGLLDESEAREMIRIPLEATGVQVDPMLEECIYEFAGGYPLFLQVACAWNWDNPGKLSEIHVQSSRELSRFFQQSWVEFSRPEKEVLISLAEGEMIEPDHPLMKITLHDLVRKCMLVEKDGGYRYSSKAWADYVRGEQFHSKGMVSSLH